MLDITASRMHSKRRCRRRQLARGLATAVDEKEKRGHTDETQRAAEHPYFIRKNGADLLRGEKGQGNSKRSGQKAAETGGDQSCLAITPACERFVHSDPQEGAEHVQKRNQLQHDRERQKFLKGFLNARAGERKVDDHENQ